MHSDEFLLIDHWVDEKNASLSELEAGYMQLLPVT